MAELIYYSGSMDSGKSTLALQTHHNHSTRGRKGIVFTTNDRSGQPLITSRLGMNAPAINLEPDINIFTFIANILETGHRVDYLICDEAQFYTPIQIDQLADIVDGLNIDAYCFGISTDFRTLLFPASARLTELADRIITPPCPAICWCGKPATHQARLINGNMVTEGEQIAVGDTNSTATPDTIAYEVLCRKHHRQHLTAAQAKATTQHTSSST